MPRQTISERAAAIHCARVFLAEAKRRRGSAFHTTLLHWAANARWRASIAPRAPAAPPSPQTDLFAAEATRC